MAEAKSCEERLSEAKAALHELLTGTNVVSVGYGERRIQFTSADINNLRQYINGLEIECGCGRRRRPFHMEW